jgi:hypothetical protein
MFDPSSPNAMSNLTVSLYRGRTYGRYYYTVSYRGNPELPDWDGGTIYQAPIPIHGSSAAVARTLLLDRGIDLELWPAHLINEEHHE